MPSFEVHLTPRFLRSVKRLSAEERQRVKMAMDRTVESWGSPHTHSVAGIRRLRRNVFESRCGLKLRLVFIAEPNSLSFFGLGTHDEIQVLLKEF